MRRLLAFTKTLWNDTHHGIVTLGGRGWTLTREQVVSSMETGEHTFHTLVNGRRAYLRVVRDGVHHPYVQTYADGVWQDNLLALPECG